MRALDAKYAKKLAKDYKLKITLRKNFKGYSLFATKPIKKGNVIAYYKFLLHKYTDKYRGVKKDMYTMSVYTKSGRFNPRLIGDVFEGSLQPPKKGIPYWGYFSNEPSEAQKANAHLDINLKSNYKNRTKLREGDTMTYKIVASKNINPGEEIMWCYGDAYARDYKTSCDH